MTDFYSDEAAKWGQAAEAAAAKLQAGVKDAVAGAGARGFMAVPGVVAEVVVTHALGVKRALAQANADIYKDGLEQIFEADTTDQKVGFGLAKLEQELYKDTLDNAFMVEAAADDAYFQRYRGRIEQIKADTDKRQAAIIEERAAIEHQVNYWREQQIAAEGATLDAEARLASTRLATAQEKLKIIPYLTQIVAAEQRMVAAEQKKAAARLKVLALEADIAAIRELMVPLYLEKAAATQDLAEAVTQEAQDRKALELMGYDKLALKKAQEDAAHQIREKEMLHEAARLEYARADRETELAKARARNTLAAYEHGIRSQVVALDKSLALDKVATKLANQLTKTLTELTHERDIYQLTAALATGETAAKVNAAAQEAASEASAVRASANRRATHYLENYIEQSISKG
jgi:hypothetical protein